MRLLRGETLIGPHSLAGRVSARKAMVLDSPLPSPAPVPLPAAWRPDSSADPAMVKPGLGAPGGPTHFTLTSRPMPVTVQSAKENPL